MTPILASVLAIILLGIYTKASVAEIIVAVVICTTALWLLGELY